jgi:hypothetical protein
MVNELDRLQGPWKVVTHADCFQVVDATGGLSWPSLIGRISTSPITPMQGIT